MSNGDKLFRKAMPVAKKRYRCHLCAGVIEIGERYKRLVGIWDYEFMNAAICRKCQRS